ncbi:MAG: epoxyqueuosine reductase QueH [Spirochaetes bacterium]|nr:epoxyqueuosine reductase QueH [Spirochaetota bacterium]
MNSKRFPKLLLHTCCGPCLTHVYEVLSQQFNVHVFYYNPNIAPRSEYQLRLREVEQFSSYNSIPVTIGNYNQKDWFNTVKPYRMYGEMSQRCFACYDFRLRETFKVAKENKFDAVCTTLTVSPYKDAERINEIGINLSKLYEIKFISKDFKSDGGYQQSIELSKKYGMYRQKYCGCIYSKLERKKSSLWSIKVKKFKESMHHSYK